MTERVLDHPLLAHPELRLIAERLAAHEPQPAETDGHPRRAAVALVFRAAAGTSGDAELLIIRRAEREGDPWSGQMGLPGGGAHPNDESLEDTALRETLEETGIDVRADGHVLGWLDENRPRTSALPAIIVRPFVAVVRSDVTLTFNHEVADALWIPLRVLRDASSQRDSVVHVRGEARNEPSFVVGSTIVWGMTNRILRSLLRLLD
ncbi:MAG TPA: CoA pyrophosphatase [Gemmatimonadaceae bacterium]|nr:CoA pyrophosphatase [Gemmatimonadaceae bacterium]